MSAPLSRARPGWWPDLSTREQTQLELMDDPHCDAAALQRTYRQFGPVNALVAGWRAVYLHQLRPRMSAAAPNTLLDIGCGGGDVARQLARWAAHDGLTLRITGIDADDRAVGYARALPPQSGVSFRQAMSGDLVRAGEHYDFVVSNHLLHHLSPSELAALLRDSEALCGRLVVHSDIERGHLAYLGFRAAVAPAFRGSFIGADGLLSIRRSYTLAELRAAAPPGWTAERPLPFRLLLTHPGRPRA